MMKHPGMLSSAKLSPILSPKGQEEGAVAGMKLWAGLLGRSCCRGRRMRLSKWDEAIPGFSFFPSSPDIVFY